MASMISCSIFKKNIFEAHLRRERSCLGGRTQVAACESEMVKNRELELLERRSPSSEWISSVSRFRIRSDEGLALETLAFQSLLVGKFRELTLKKWEVPAGRISRNASRQDIIKRNNFCGCWAPLEDMYIERASLLHTGRFYRNGP